LPGAGDHKDERVVVIAKSLPRMMELRVHRPVYSVVLIRAVVGQRHHMPCLFVAQSLVAHRVHRSSLPLGAQLSSCRAQSRENATEAVKRIHTTAITARRSRM